MHCFIQNTHIYAIITRINLYIFNIIVYLCIYTPGIYKQYIFIFNIIHSVYILYIFSTGRNIRAVLYGTGRYIQTVYYAMLLYTVCILLHYIRYCGGCVVVWGGLLQIARAGIYSGYIAAIQPGLWRVLAAFRRKNNAFIMKTFVLVMQKRLNIKQEARATPGTMPPPLFLTLLCIYVTPIKLRTKK